MDLTKGLDTPTFRFDFALHETASNEVVRRFIARPLCTRFSQAEKNLFCMWPEGSGKTHPLCGGLSGEAQMLLGGCPGSEEGEEPLV